MCIRDSFCSSVPYVYMGQQHRALWVWIITPWEASVLEISSMAMIDVYKRQP